LQEFALLGDFIQSNRQVFRFNYSPNNIPFLEFADTWSKDFARVCAPSDERGAGGSIS
jgi:hypothetical protein